MFCMSSAITLVFPHQLFKHHPAVNINRTVYLIEEDLYFNQYRFNKKKIVQHRASLKAYQNHLEKKGIKTFYIEAISSKSKIEILLSNLAGEGLNEIHYADVTDNWLQKHISNAAEKNNIKTVQYNTPYFITDVDEAKRFFANKKSYFQIDFYKHQRQRLGILMDGNKPAGGRWSFDDENRLKFPKGEIVPEINLPKTNVFVQEAITYTEKNFANNYGTTKPPFSKKDGFFPTTFDEAETWLFQFLDDRFTKFGVYEDAMVKEQGVLYHSVLTPMMNTGLLTPKQVIDEALKVAKHKYIPINSVEGFIRQVIGWREYLRVIYELEGSVQRTKNYWGFTRKIPYSF